MVRRNSKLASCWQRKVARRSALNNGYIRIKHILARFGSNAPSFRSFTSVRLFPERCQSVSVATASAKGWEAERLLYGPDQAKAAKAQLATRSSQLAWMAK